MYKLLIEKQVQKQLEKLPVSDYNRVKASINHLASNPRPAGHKKLKGRLGYRIRQGVYRIVYDINDDILSVYILDVGHRKDIYR
jgi:mRNA interferase RelE/StbE